jgi:creatinine amidohydrolase
LSKVSLGELTLKDVRDYLRTGNKIIIPVGTTEQHSEHLPFTADTDIVTEVSLRVADKVGALVAPPLHYGLSQDHQGFPGTAWLRAETFGRVIEDISASYAKNGFKRVIWLNGHYCNQAALRTTFMDLTGTDKIPPDAKVYGFSYWLPLPEKAANEYLSSDAGWHAQVGETSIMLAIRPSVVKMENAPVEWPTLGGKSVVVRDSITAGTATWRLVAGKTGAWGDARDATKEKGERFLDEIVEAVSKTIEEIELAFQEMEKQRILAEKGRY